MMKKGRLSAILAYLRDRTAVPFSDAHVIDPQCGHKEKIPQRKRNWKTANRCAGFVCF